MKFGEIFKVPTATLDSSLSGSESEACNHSVIFLQSQKSEDVWPVTFPIALVTHAHALANIIAKLFIAQVRSLYLSSRTFTITRIFLSGS